MPTFQNTITIACPADEVFAFLADLRNIPKWNYAIERTVQTSPGPARAGASYRQTRTIPRRSEENLQITAFEPPSRLTVNGQLGSFRATTSYLLQPAAGGTRLTNDVELEPISALLRPAGRTENQAGGGGQPQHAETAAGNRPPDRRRRTVTIALAQVQPHEAIQHDGRVRSGGKGGGSRRGLRAGQADVASA